MGDDGELFKDFERYRDKKPDSEKKDKPKDGDHKRIKVEFEIVPIWVERIGYWIIIAVLMTLIIWNPFTGILSGFTTQTETSDSGASITDVEEPDTVEETTTEEDTSDEEDVVEETTPTLSGDVTIVLTEVVTNVNNSLRLEEVKFSIDNQKKGFTPRVKLFIYTNDDPGQIKLNPSADITYSYLKPGTKKNYIINSFNKRYFSEGATAYIEVYDSKSMKNLLSKDERDT